MEVNKDAPLTFCIGTYNNLEYLKIAIKSIRENSYYKNAPFIVYGENCSDGTDEWLEAYHQEYGLDYYIEKNKKDDVRGIGGGLNFIADRVDTEYILFSHSDMYHTKDWDKALLDVYEKYPDRKLGWVCSQRIEPRIFNEHQQSRPGTVIVDKDIFGAYYNDFDSERFEQWAQEFIGTNDFEIPKGEGVSGLIRKEDWDTIGGNDHRFAPASWEDMDLFWRMIQMDYEFVLTSKSLVYHFGARGSHFPDDDFSKSSERQIGAEQVNRQKFIDKWGGPPTFDNVGMISGIKK